MLVADAHTDLLLELGRALRGGVEDAFADTWLPLLERGGVRLQVCPIFVEPDLQPEGSLRAALAQTAAFTAAAREQPDRAVSVRTAAELDAALDTGRIALLLALEGLEPFGHEIWPADLFHELGMRMASLTWNRRNAFADGAAEEGGLSRRGRELVARLVELGVVIDLAHASRALFDEVLALAEPGRVLVSHAGCRSLVDHPRNVDDARLRALAERGGVFGLMLHPLALGYEELSVERACEHLEHAAETVGADRVVLGGDFSERLNAVLAPTPASELLLPGGRQQVVSVPGLEGPEDYPALAASLIGRGWSAADVEAVMGTNLVRFLRAALG